jgi:hypothetical protein
MGTISFHIHGELAKGTAIASNVSVYISPSLYNNPAAEDAISNMRTIFTDKLAVIFGNDWLTRTVSAGYLSGNVLRPPSSPIKASRRNNEHVPLLSSPSSRQGRSPSHLSSISSTSSLTNTTAIADETTPTPICHNHSGRLPSAPHAAHPSDQTNPTGQVTRPGLPPGLILPNPLTLSSTITLSAAAIALTPTSALGPLSEEVREFMVSIGKDTVGNHDVVREIYDYIGRALWENSVVLRLHLNTGTARALVSLMLAV